MELVDVLISDWIRHVGPFPVTQNFQNADGCHATTDKRKKRELKYEIVHNN